MPKNKFIRLFANASAFFLFGSLVFAQNSMTDSLVSILRTAKEDSVKIKILNDLAWKLKNSNPDSSILLSGQALAIANTTKQSLPEHWKQVATGQCFHQLGAFHGAKGNYPIALDFYFKALSVWDKLERASEVNDRPRIKVNKSKTLGNVGIIYDELKDYEKALDYYFKALKMDEELGRKGGIGTKYINIGLIYKEQADELQKRTGDHRKIDSLYQKALDYYLSALKIEEELGSKINVAICLGNIGAVYNELKKYSEALNSYLKALEIDEEIGDKTDMAIWIQDIGSLYSDINKYNEAEKYLMEALQISKEIGAIDDEMKTERDLSVLYAKTNRYQLALEHYKQEMILKDTLFNEDRSKEVTRKEMSYEFEKKEAVAKAEQEKQLAVAEAEKKKQQIVLYSVIGGLLVVLMFLGFIFRSLRITRKQKIVIEGQKQIVEEKQKEILDSIHYAKRIQTALLPTEKYIDKTLKRLMK